MGRSVFVFLLCRFVSLGTNGEGLFVFVNLYSSSAPSFQDHGQLSYSVCLMSFILSLSLAFEQHVINCAVAVCEHQGEPSVCNEAFFCLSELSSQCYCTK